MAHKVGDIFPARELTVDDVGSSVISQFYQDKRKTTAPQKVRLASGGPWEVAQLSYVIESIYAHQNGNILINQNIYLRPNTLIQVAANV